MASHCRIAICTILLTLIPFTSSARDIYRFIGGWEGRIAAFSILLGSTEARVTGGTQAQCTAALNRRINELRAAGYTVIGAPACHRIISAFIIFDNYPDLEPKFDAEFCAACLLMKTEIITRIYPSDVSDAVIVLKDKYRIDEFNREIQSLRQRYNTDGFQNELYQLELKSGASLR